MGRTLPPFRFGLHSEIASWKRYRKVLRKIDRESFDAMIDGSTHYWSAASNAPRPFLFESLVMSIIFAHQAKLERMTKDLARLRSELVSARLENKETSESASA
jgi:hypothetical protein